VVTHDVAHLFGYADRALMLYEGRAIECDTPEALRRSENAVVRQFITGSMTGPIQV
jgi:phospholipid/cholesterol/gamma-HCH transport system ATP-binding protein